MARIREHIERDRENLAAIIEYILSTKSSEKENKPDKSAE